MNFVTLFQYPKLRTGRMCVKLAEQQYGSTILLYCQLHAYTCRSIDWSQHIYIKCYLCSRPQSITGIDLWIYKFWRISHKLLSPLISFLDL